jgi:hypothetical protein
MDTMKSLLRDPIAASRGAHTNPPGADWDAERIEDAKPWTGFVYPHVLYVHSGFSAPGFLHSSRSRRFFKVSKC